jgi:hypothetical protein
LNEIKAKTVESVKSVWLEKGAFLTDEEEEVVMMIVWMSCNRVCVNEIDGLGLVSDEP